MVSMICLLTIASQLIGNTVSTISWSSGPNSLPAALYGGMIATTPNEDVYILGGFCCGGRKTSIYKWSSSSSATWTTLSTNTPTDLYCPGQCSVLMPNGLFYIIGAYPQHGKTFVFDPSSDNFTTPSPAIPDMIHPVAYGCVAGDLINNKIYVIGGTQPTSSTSYVNYIQIYDITNNIWSVSANTIPNAFSLATCYLSSTEGLLYVFGGQTYPTTSYWNTILKYDINAQTVDTLSTATLSVARYGARVQYIAQQNGVYLIAGYSGSASKVVELFDLNTETISTDGINHLNVLGSYVHTTFVQNRIMVFGGYGTTWLDSSEQTDQTFSNSVVNTSKPTTTSPTTDEPTTSQPTTSEPTTSEPTTFEPTTSEPTTSEPTTSEPTTSDPTTSDPTTSEPTTSEPTAFESTTRETTTPEITTKDDGTDICDVSDESNNRCHGRAKNCHKDSKRQSSKYNTFTDTDTDPWCGWCLCADSIDSNNPLEECAYYALSKVGIDNWKAYFITNTLKGLFMDICFGHIAVDKCAFDDVELNEPVSGCDCETFTCNGEQGETTTNVIYGGDANQYGYHIAILISFLVYVMA